MPNSKDVFGNIIHLTQIGSTNDELVKMANQGAMEGTVIIADHQTNGHGRLGRTWLSPPNSSILMSILFRPWFLDIRYRAWLINLCAIAMRQAVKQCANVDLQIKWPNDLIANDGRKIAGLLAATSPIINNQLSWIVVGIGLNVNFCPADDLKDQGEASRHFYTGENVFPDKMATSLSVILDRDTKDLLSPIVDVFLREVENRYYRLKHDLFAPADLHKEMTSHLSGLGQEINLYTETGETIHGTFEGIDSSSALLLHSNDGRFSYTSGELTLMPNK